MPSSDALRAQSIGSLVRPWRPATGEVHSAYPGAVNLALGGRLYALVPASAGDGPTTIRLREEDFAGLSGVSAGAAVALRAASLAVARTRIDLRTAAVWVQGGPPTAVAPGIAGRLDGLRARAVDRGGAGWIEGLTQRALIGRADAVRALVGRGIGLTPSGDDALVGALAGCAALAGSNAGAGRVGERLGAHVLGRLERTNDLSAAFLRAAAEGHFQRRLWEAVVALVTAGGTDATAALLSTGATSGADGALGIAAAISFLIDRTSEVAA